MVAARAAKAAAVVIAMSGAGTAAYAIDFAPSMGTWKAPAEYRIDMEVDAEGQHFTMHRFISNGKTRSDMKTPDGMEFVMLEMGDADGTSYTLMPEEKSAIKQTRTGMEAIAAKVSPEVAAKTALSPDEVPPAPGNMVNAGREKVDGIECDKLIYTFDGVTATSWVDAATGRPVKMESAQGTIEWKNYVAGSQKKELFAVPSDYQVTDVDEMMKQMSDSGMGGALSGMLGGGGMGGLGALGGMAGMPGGGLGGMAQNFGGQMGSNFGAGLGGALGGALGGPLGAMAGQYLGGAVGGMVGKKVAGAVTGN